jgi:hypothetical protein
MYAEIHSGVVAIHYNELGSIIIHALGTECPLDSLVVWVHKTWVPNDALSSVRTSDLDIPRLNSSRFLSATHTIAVIGCESGSFHEVNAYF